MAIRVVPISEAAPLWLAGWSLIDYVTYASTLSRVWAVLAMRMESAPMVLA